MQECQHVYKSDPDKRCPYPGYYERWRSLQEQNPELQITEDRKLKDFVFDLKFYKGGFTNSETTCHFHSNRQIVDESDYYNVIIETKLKDLITIMNWDSYISSIILDEIYFRNNKHNATTIQGHFSKNFLVVGCRDSDYHYSYELGFNLVSIDGDLNISNNNCTIKLDGGIHIKGDLIFGNTIDSTSIQSVVLMDFTGDILEDYGLKVDGKIHAINFDLGALDLPSRKYLLMMKAQGKFIEENCTWSGLPALTTQESDQKSKLFTFTDSIPLEYRDYFGQYFMGFKDFVMLAKGKQIGIEVKMNGKLELTVYSDVAEDLVDIEADFKEFLANIISIVRTGKPFPISFRKGLEPNAETVLIGVQAQVNTLTTQIQLKDVMIKSQNLTIITKSQTIENITKELMSKTDQIEQMNTFMLEHTKPTVYLEGETDERYFKKALEFFADEFPNLRDVDFVWIGRNEQSGPRHTGTTALNSDFDFYKSNISKAAAKTIFLHDCDTNSKFESYQNKLYKLCIEQNYNNSVFKKGIENLFDEKFFEESFVDRKQYYNLKKQTTEQGELKVNEIFEKTDFCNYIISRNNKLDFENFKDILAKLNEILN